MLAESNRSVKFNVSIMDANAVKLSKEKVLERLKELKPRYLLYLWTKC